MWGGRRQTDESLDEEEWTVAAMASATPLRLALRRPRAAATAAGGGRGALCVPLYAPLCGRRAGIIGMPAWRASSSAVATGPAVAGNDAAATQHAGAEASAVAARQPRNARALIKCYGQLGKARLSALVVASASCGFLLAGSPVDPVGLGAVTAGVALQSFAANSFNQVYEVKTDALMKRTRARPLPSGRISRGHAAAFGVASGLAGTALLAGLCNPVSAGLGVANIVLYAGIYTPLKQKTIYNTHVGAVVGALPPLIGYSAATGTLSVEAALLGAGLYLWQFPHFYALAYMYKADYLAGNHKMMPCFDATGRRTAAAILRYSVALSTLPLACYSLGITGSMFPIESIVFNGLLLHASYRFAAAPTVGNARKAFKASLLYLPVFMGLMIFHKKGWTEEEHQELMASARPAAGSHALDKPAPSAPPSSAVEAALCQAKAAMRGVCVHEYLVKPPLTRLDARGEASRDAAPPTPPASTLADSSVMCPLTQASRAYVSLGRRASRAD